MMIQKGMMAKVDLVISLLLALALTFLFINGDHISPRERLYEEKRESN